MPTNENAARADRLAEKLAAIPDAAFDHAVASGAEITRLRYEAVLMLRDYAAALRSADADRPARAAKAPALSALLDSIARGHPVYISDDRLAACRAELAALTEPSEPKRNVPTCNCGGTSFRCIRCDEPFEFAKEAPHDGSEMGGWSLAKRETAGPSEPPEGREPCLTCGGSGFQGQWKCPDCGGSGNDISDDPEPKTPEPSEPPCKVCGQPPTSHPHEETPGPDGCFCLLTAEDLVWLRAPKTPERKDGPHEPIMRSAATVPRSSDVAAGGERVEVAAFAGLMEDRLRRHDERRGADGWKGETLDFLFDQLQGEVDELQVARLPDAIAEEAADVANYAMMLADVAGGLSDRTVRVLRQRRAANVPSDVAGGWEPGTLSTDRLRREMPTLAAVADSYADEVEADVQAGGERAVDSVQPDSYTVRIDGELRQAANVTRLPSSGADPALILLAKAQEVVSADIAYRKQLETRCERQADLIQRLEAKVRELEGHG